MIENTINNSSNNTSSTTNELSQINVKVDQQIEEKSTFERAIIEAFKQTNSNECIKKLLIAYDEIKFFIKDINQSNGKKFILNKNFLDKISRIIERKFFNVNILIAKIFNELLDTNNFEILSNDLNLLISFSNEILNILDIVNSTNISHDLEKKCSCFLNFLLNNTKFVLEDEQKETLQELLNNFPMRNSSEIYKNFVNIKEDIIANCKSDIIEDKLEGVINLMESFGDTYSLEEQFDLLLENGQQIIKALINKPNPEYKKVYFQLGNFIISMLYPYKFKIKVDKKKKLLKKNSKTFYLIDCVENEEKNKNNIKLNKSHSEYSIDDMEFLNDCKFELTNQKDLLLKCENIFSLCLLILNTLNFYENIFDLQYICYLLIKKIYFIFPQFRKNIEDLLASNLTNICSNFKEESEKNNIVECKQFLFYLLKGKNIDEELKEKLKHRIEAKGNVIKIDEENEENNINEEDIEFDILDFSDFNLRVGYPNLYNIDAGSKNEKYIEIDNNNSLIYIGFATHAYDINLHLLRYCPNLNDNNENNDNNNDFNDKGHFIEMFKLERINCSEIPIKIILFVKEAGIYKIVFDNEYSWITAKTVRSRLSVLKPVSEINLEKLQKNNNVIINNEIKENNENENEKIEVNIDIK